MSAAPQTGERHPLPCLAAVLSVVPGAGQIYAGRVKRGLGIFLVLLAQAAALHIADAPRALPWLILIWLWNIADARNAALGRPRSLAPVVVVLAALNLVAGWQFSEMGEQIRQVDAVSGLAKARSLVSALARPDIIRSSELQTADADIAVGGAAPKPSGSREPGPRLTLAPSLVKPGQSVSASGSGFAPESAGQLFLRSGGDKQIAAFTTDASGRFRARFVNRLRIPGSYWIEAEVRKSLPVTQWSASEPFQTSVRLMMETVFLAFLGTAISLLISLPLSFLAARNLTGQIPAGWAVYSATRAAFNILRSIEVLIIAVIMAIIVGIGPLAGVLALAIHGVGALGKLYSEAIESVEHGPIEAVISTGANWLQVIRFGAIPQVVPQFIAFTMYRWDINVRMATVIGLVGGGGIGNLLMSYINTLQWEQAATALWLIAVVVMLMDYTSAVIRERVV